MTSSHAPGVLYNYPFIFNSVDFTIEVSKQKPDIYNIRIIDNEGFSNTVQGKFNLSGVGYELVEPTDLSPMETAVISDFLKRLNGEETKIGRTTKAT
jgi:uncharacterized protein YfkK (UPF0435 family)